MTVNRVFDKLSDTMGLIDTINTGLKAAALDGGDVNGNVSHSLALDATIPIAKHLARVYKAAGFNAVAEVYLDDVRQRHGQGAVLCQRTRSAWQLPTAGPGELKRSALSRRVPLQEPCQ